MLVTHFMNENPTKNGYCNGIEVEGSRLKIGGGEIRHWNLGLGISFHSVTRWFPLLLVSKDKDQRIFRRDNEVQRGSRYGIYTQLARSSLTRHRFFVRSRAGRIYLIYEITRPRISFYCAPWFSLMECENPLWHEIKKDTVGTINCNGTLYKYAPTIVNRIYLTSLSSTKRKDFR